MPGVFALCVEVFGNVTMSFFAAFGSIALLLFADFSGPLRHRLALQGTLILAGLVLISVGTLATWSPWLAAMAMALVAFGVVFSGVVSSVVAGSTTSLLATFILAVTLPGSPGSLPGRLAGHLLAGAVSLIAVSVLWPAAVHEPLRGEAARSCVLIARRLRLEAHCVRADAGEHRVAARQAADEATAAVAELRKAFFATPFRPTGLATEARVLVQLVDELLWLDDILQNTAFNVSSASVASSVRQSKLAAADVLEACATGLGGAPALEALHAGKQRLHDAMAAVEQAVTTGPYVPEDAPVHVPSNDFASPLKPGFRSQEISSAVSAIVTNVAVVLAARERQWWERALGRRPTGVSSPLSSAQERTAAHATLRSVWLRSSFRAAIALGLAVLIAELTGVQHSFWVVFGTMAVLRSNALQTGQNALRAIFGTVVGIVVGGALIYALGSNTMVFWILLPFAIVFSGLTPAAISFTAGQAAFTAALLILFNIIDPVGWTIGFVRVEDMAIGCAVSLGVGLLFWPRGAGSALGVAMADAVAESAHYLRRAVEYGIGRCDSSVAAVSPPVDERRLAAAAARRLDDAFREFLAERGAKRLPMAEVTKVITAVAVIRLTADAVSSLWEREAGAPAGDRANARAELLAASSRVCAWYRDAARALAGHGKVPKPLEQDLDATDRLLSVIRHDAASRSGSTKTAAKVMWTADHIDVARRLQSSVAEPLRAAATLQRGPDPASVTPG
ncbi:FUSC family protein [Streptomyces sp. SID1121]|uniref:FUSC family protein n=1 Tax=Streptomyces sp. SID1121 TaxID=3425888 RepID=UPI004056D2B1